MKPSEIFGKPNEGIHSYRIFGMAAVDLIGTFIGAILLAIFLKQNVFLIFAILMVIATIAHILMGVNTTIVRTLTCVI